MADLTRHPGSVGEVFNVGNTKEITINALAELIKRMTGSKSEIIHIPYDRAYEKGFEDMPRRVPDISKIQRLVGYEPSVDLEGILERIIRWFRSSEQQELAASQPSVS